MPTVRCYKHGKRRIGGGQSGEVKVEMLLGGALAIIIIGSLVLMILPLFKGSEKGTKGDGKWHYQCQKCGEEWDVDGDKMLEEIMAAETSGRGARGPYVGEESYYPDCPLCEAKAMSIRMIQCLNTDCERFFVTELMKNPSLGGGPMGDNKGAPQVCTYCGTDRWDVIRENAKKAREKAGK